MTYVPEGMVYFRIADRQIGKGGYLWDFEQERQQSSQAEEERY